MEKARCNTELYSNLRPPLNNVKPSNFRGSHHLGFTFVYVTYVFPSENEAAVFAASVALSATFSTPLATSAALSMALTAFAPALTAPTLPGTNGKAAATASTATPKASPTAPDGEMRDSK